VDVDSYVPCHFPVSTPPVQSMPTIEQHIKERNGDQKEVQKDVFQCRLEQLMGCRFGKDAFGVRKKTRPVANTEQRAAA